MSAVSLGRKSIAMPLEKNAVPTSVGLDFFCIVQTSAAHCCDCKTAQRQISNKASPQTSNKASPNISLKRLTGLTNFKWGRTFQTTCHTQHFKCKMPAEAERTCTE